MHGLGERTAMLAAAARALLGRELRLPEEAEAIDFAVDGVAMTASVAGLRSLRLSCAVAAQMPQDEEELRAVMAGFLPYCDRTETVLCGDKEGRLLAVIDVEAGQDIEAVITDFCNAAIHWTKLVARHPTERPYAPGPVLIFP